nr:reverse transcriptase domain-containing protein [Tanacetum cinerariifolium]
TGSRDHSCGRSRPHRLDASNEDRPENRERFRGVGESYDNSHSSYRTGINHGYRYHDRDRSRHMKRGRDSESPLSSVSKNFMVRFKVETGRMKGAPECMRIYGFMHGVNNPELAKRLNEHVPKTMKEMIITTIAFIRGEAIAASKKKGHTSWRTQDQSKRQTSKRREVMFPSLATSSGAEGPLVIEAEISGHMIHRMYVDGGSSMEVLYEHCFNRLWPEVKNQMVSATTSLTGFSGETIWPMGQLKLLLNIDLISERDIYPFRKNGPGPGTRQGHPSRGAKISRGRDYERDIRSGTSLQATKAALVEITPAGSIQTKGGVDCIHVRVRGMVQMLFYFISHALQGPEMNYTPMEKLVLSLVFTAKRLKRYFQAHPIAIITDQPIKKIMSRPDVAGRLQKWSVMLEEHNITYRPRTSVKGQVLADFLAEMLDESPSDASVVETQQEPWTLFTDGLSCVDGSSVGLILTSPEGTEFTYALRFQFAASNNEAEYEALIAGLQI